MKREKRELRKDLDDGQEVATRDDLAGYGFPIDEADEAEESETVSE